MSRKYLSNINNIDNCWNLLGIEYAVSDVFLYFYFFCHSSSCSQYQEIFQLQNIQDKKILDLRNSHENRWHNGTRPTRPTMTRSRQNLHTPINLWNLSEFCIIFAKLKVFWVEYSLINFKLTMDCFCGEISLNINNSR